MTWSLAKKSNYSTLFLTFRPILPKSVGPLWFLCDSNNGNDGGINIIIVINNNDDRKKRLFLWLPHACRSQSFKGWGPYGFSCLTFKVWLSSSGFFSIWAEATVWKCRLVHRAPASQLDCSCRRRTAIITACGVFFLIIMSPFPQRVRFKCADATVSSPMLCATWHQSWRKGVSSSPTRHAQAPTQ